MENRTYGVSMLDKIARDQARLNKALDEAGEGEALGKVLAQDKLWERVEKDFTYHPPVSSSQKSAFMEVRGVLLEAAETLIHLVPEGRELSSALTKLEEAMFHANAGIARHWEEK